MLGISVIIGILLLSGGLGRLNGQVRLTPDVAEKLLLEKPEPIYPELAKKLKVQGTVRLEITVSESGTVTSTTAISGHPLLIVAALDAIKQSKYKPYSPDGKTVPFVTVVEITFSLGIPEEDYDRDQKLADRYFKQEDKCRQLLTATKWKEAEKVCRANLPIADQLASHRGLEKMVAYENAGLSLLAQGKFREALDYFSTSMKFAQYSLTEHDADLGQLYVELGLANFGLGNLDGAREFYTIGEKILQFAYNDMDDSELRERYMMRLKRALGYHLRAATAAGANAEAQALKKRLEGIP